MSDDVVFYRLSTKVVERDSDIPAGARDVVYYSLAIGHHIGVFDCFKPVLRCRGEFYEQIVGQLPEGEARRKLDGIRRFGEITIDRTHVRLLGEAIAEARSRVTPEQRTWFDALAGSLAAIEREPAIYLMGRRRPCAASS